MDNIADNTQTNLSGVTIAENKVFQLDDKITSADPKNGKEEGDQPLQGKGSNRFLDSLSNLGIIIGAVLAIGGVVWFFVSLIIEQKDIKDEIITTTKTLEKLDDTIDDLGNNIDDLKDTNIDFRIQINRLIDKTDMLINNK